MSEKPPSQRGAAVGRRLAVGTVRGIWRPRVLGAWRVPARGPVILAVNHSHNIDGPLLMGTSPRPVHFLIKKQAFVGPLGTFLRSIGQLSVDRESADRGAMADVLGVLARGGVLGIFPEGTRGDGDFQTLHTGLAYFAIRSGAPVVPVAVLGGSAGRVPGAFPSPRARLDIVFGAPFEATDGGPTRRTRGALQAATGRIQRRLSGHLAEAGALTGRCPGTRGQ